MHGWWVSRDRHGDDILGRGELYSLDVLVRVKSIMRIYILALNAILTINDYVWRENRELLTNKTELPVIQLRFGDTG